MPTINKERERIICDIHDGVGGQLVSTIAMMEREQANPLLIESLQFALDDLRLMIDSLSPEDKGLFPLLAMLRYCFDPRFEQLGIALQPVKEYTKIMMRAV